MTFTTPQSFPTPTAMPPMRAGEVDGRYMDCSPTLLPISDLFTSINTITITVTRCDGVAIGANDLQVNTSIAPVLDPTGMIVTFWYNAPIANAGADYILTLTANPTFEGRTFVRDWTMSIVPLLG